MFTSPAPTPTPPPTTPLPLEIAPEPGMVAGATSLSDDEVEITRVQVPSRAPTYKPDGTVLAPAIVRASMDGWRRVMEIKREGMTAEEKERLAAKNARKAAQAPSQPQSPDQDGNGLSG